MAKVIHVHLTTPIPGNPRKDWYFSSISAIYTVLTPEQVGAGYAHLSHAGLSGNGTVITKRAIIKQSDLISASRKLVTGLLRSIEEVQSHLEGKKELKKARDITF